MILSETIEISISNNGKYWRDRGYGPCKQRDVITVKVSDLPPNSNKKVLCRCIDCSEEFERQFQLVNRVAELRCFGCTRKFLGPNIDQSKNIARLKTLVGPKHPRWSAESSLIRQYTTRVHYLTKLTYKRHEATINPNGFTRTLCGVDGGYQLDHKTSIKKAYHLGWTPEQCADISNLQLLPWADNRRKWK